MIAQAWARFSAGGAARTQRPARLAFAARDSSHRIDRSKVASPRRLPLALAASFAVLLILALSASPALARKLHHFSSSFGAAASTPANPYPLSGPAGVAVNNSTHDTYVVDAGHLRVEKFDSAGNLTLMFGKEVDKTKVEEVGSTEAEQNVCTIASGDTCQSGTQGSTPGFSVPFGVAVDSSGGASSGDVYVDDFNNGIEKFSSSGVYVSTIGSARGGVATDPSGNVWGATGSGEGGEAFGVREWNPAGESIAGWEGSFYSSAAGIAADFSDVYVLMGGSGQGGVGKYTTAGTPLADITACGPSCVSRGVAVDPTIDLSSKADLIFSDHGNYVATYYSSGKPLEHFGVGVLEAGGGIGVDSSDGTVYVAEGAHNDVDVFSQTLQPDPTAKAADEITATAATLRGLLNTDSLSPSDAITDCHFQWDTNPSYSNNHPSLPCEQSPGSIPTDGEDHEVTAHLGGLQANTTYYFRLDATNESGSGENQSSNEEFGPPIIDSQSSSNITTTTATLEAKVNPHGSDTTYHFEYGLESCAGHPCTSIPISDADIGASPGDHSVSQSISGLLPGKTYHYRVVATNPESPAGGTAGTGQSFETVPPLRIDQTSAENITATSVDLGAQINPLGTKTSYHFDYIPDSAFKQNLAESKDGFAGASRIPLEVDASAGSGSSDRAVTQHLEQLSASTIYHYRVVADNAIAEAFGGPVAGPPSAFETTSLDGTFPLPDKRAYEMVTPPYKNGNAAKVFPTSIEFGFGGFSEAGTQFAASSLGGFAGYSSLTPDYLIERTPTGWATGAFQLSSVQYPDNGAVAVSPDFQSAIWSASHSPEEPTTEAPTPDFYLTTPGAGPIRIGPGSPPGDIHDNSALNLYGAARDLSRGVYADFSGHGGKRLWPGDATVPVPGNGLGNPSLYEYSGTENTEPSLVGISDEGHPASVAASHQISTCGTGLGSGDLGQGSAYNAVSADGSHVFFTAKACGGAPDEIFDRKDGTQTVAISEPSTGPGGDCSACDTSAPADATFAGASADGSRVFFTTTQALLGEDATRNLYLYDFNAPAHEKVIEASASSDPEGAQVQGVSRISQDGSHTYFVAKGVLATNDGAATNPETGLPQQATEGHNNLYLYERDAAFPEGHLAFIASLSPADGPDWSATDERPVQATPDGRFLVFQSAADLTPDDTSTVQQVFLYDAQGQTLARVSHGQEGINDNGNTDTDPATIPVQKFFRSLPTQRFASLAISADGAYVFFSSDAALTPQVSGGIGNAYEYHEGQVSLISDGRDAETVQGTPTTQLLGTDESGRDVFFETAASLLPQDANGQVDLYDARIGGGFKVESEPSCLGDACQGPQGQPPVNQSPASLGFTGPGNPAPKHRHPSKRHKKHAKKKAHRRRGANANRRAAK